MSPDESRLLTIGEVMGIVRLGRSTIYRRLQTNEFPRPIDLGNAVRWKREEVQQWIDDREQRHYRPRAA